MKMSEYNRDQWEALLMVRHCLEGLPASETRRLRATVGPYLEFRSEVSRFQKEFLFEICTQACFSTRHSACCNRDGIATFFADVVINALLSSGEDLTFLEQPWRMILVVSSVSTSARKACLWRLKPIVCEMFLCDRAKETVLGKDKNLSDRWEGLLRDEKQFTWPDKPILFDDLEQLFLQAGLKSSLMYCHLSPGLLRVKAQSSRKG